jgi:hypothetical protein
MNPKKLVEFSKDNMVTKEAEKYLCHVVKSEMLWGLKKYLHVELFKDSSEGGKRCLSPYSLSLAPSQGFPIHRTQEVTLL